MEIGQWVRRESRQVPKHEGKWHLVESVVAEDAITRCGRRMDEVTPDKGLALQVTDVEPPVYQICERCKKDRADA